jgi:hypothetical protein
MENLKWGWGNIKNKSTQAILLLQISDFSLDFVLFYILKMGRILVKFGDFA